MDKDDLEIYGDFGFRRDYIHDPNDPTSIFNARKALLVFPDSLPLHQQIKLKRTHDSLTQSQLGKIVRLKTSTISLIETGQRLIPRNRLQEFSKYLYEDWYMNGILIATIDQDDPEEPIEMDLDGQRAYWKAQFDKEDDLYGTIL